MAKQSTEGQAQEHAQDHAFNEVHRRTADECEGGHGAVRPVAATVAVGSIGLSLVLSVEVRVDGQARAAAQPLRIGKIDR
jgi:hypothetical protein